MLASWRCCCDASSPRMVATTAAVAERLSAGGGPLYRYLHEESPDGIPGDGGAFVLCSFWLVENLAKQGKLDEAASLYADVQISRIQLSDKASCVCPQTVARRRQYLDIDQSELLVKVLIREA